MSWTLFAARAGAREAGRIERELQAGGGGVALFLALAYVIGRAVTDSHDLIPALLAGTAVIFGVVLVLGLAVAVIAGSSPGTPPPAPPTPRREPARELIARIQRENGARP
jgi:hypothetical protein